MVVKMKRNQVIVLLNRVCLFLMNKVLVLAKVKFSQCLADDLITLLVNLPC